MNQFFTEHDLLDAFLKNATLKIFWKDPQRRFLGASQSFLDYYGFTSVSEILGKTDEDMGWHIDPDPYKNDEYHVIQTGQSVFDSKGTCIIKGQVRHILATKMPVYNTDKMISGLVGYFIDVTEAKKYTEELEHLVKNDSLTNLANRNGLSEAVDAYVNEYKKHGTNFAILFLDVNDFKAINDTYGHDVGDQCLKQVAAELVSIAGNTSVVARYGGDEFVILRQIPPKDSDSPLSNTILSMIEHIHLKQKEARLINNHFLRTELSIGYSTFSETGNFDEALKLADQRMYEEKNSSY